MSEVKQAGQKTGLDSEVGSPRPQAEEESLWPLERRSATWEEYSVLLLWTLSHYLVRMVILQKGA